MDLKIKKLLKIHKRSKKKIKIYKQNNSCEIIIILWILSPIHVLRHPVDYNEHVVRLIVTIKTKLKNATKVEVYPNEFDTNKWVN